MLRTEPSFSIYNSEEGLGEENEKQDSVLINNDGSLPLERSVTTGDSMGSREFSFGNLDMGLIQEDENEKEQDNEDEETLNGIKNLDIEEIVTPAGSPPMYLATGFGMDGNGVDFDEGDDVEEYYKRMVSENPSNPFFLKNYAQLLQSKGDLPGAEDFYFRATLADPSDGEILSEYAKLVWELHHDKDRALNYFESAVHAAPKDSHVLAAYASFLWEVDDDKNEDFAYTSDIQTKDEILDGFGSNTDYTAATDGEGVNTENYFKRMVEENSCNPLFLRNYAQFLYQSKRDLKGAESYYSRAMLADPRDSEIMSQYAHLVWELYHDHDKAVSYFERAVQVAPDDSHILAAYARFLWETDGVDEHSGQHSSNSF